MSVQPPGPVIEKGSYIPRVTLVAEGWTNFPPDSPGLQVAVRGNLMPGSKPGGE